MRYFFIVASLIASALAVNSFTAPLGDTILYAGDSTVISWNNTGGGSKIDLFLKKGESSDLSTVATIGKDVSNEGKVLWNIPTSISTGAYALEIIELDSSGSEISDTANYTPKFQIVNNVTVSTTSTTSTSSTSSIVSSTSTTLNTTTIMSSSSTTMVSNTSSTMVVSSSSSALVSSTSVTSTTAASTTSSAATSTSSSNGAANLQYSSLVAGIAAIGAAIYAF